MVLEPQIIAKFLNIYLSINKYHMSLPKQQAKIPDLGKKKRNAASLTLIPI